MLIESTLWTDFFPEPIAIVRITKIYFIFLDNIVTYFILCSQFTRKLELSVLIQRGNDFNLDIKIYLLKL